MAVRIVTVMRSAVLLLLLAIALTAGGVQGFKHQASTGERAGHRAAPAAFPQFATEFAARVRTVLSHPQPQPPRAGAES